MPETDFKRDLEEAEMILVGLGSEFDVYGLREKTEGSRMGDGARKALEKLENTDYAWLIPAVRDVLQDDGRVGAALEKLCGLLEGKNYFLLSQAQSALIPQVRWREGRLVMPCGSAWKKQCAENCGAETAEREESCAVLTQEERQAVRVCCESLEAWLEAGGREQTAPEKEGLPGISGRKGLSPETAGTEREKMPDEVRRALERIGRDPETEKVSSLLRARIPEDLLGRCPRCGKGMVLNVVQAARYDESGYLDGWRRYTAWLQGSVNRKLLVVELGVGMQFPGMIRVPFERIVFLNQKAKLYRIHENLYQTPEHLGEKGVGIAENTIDWLNNL